jgi:hypothetical protein
MPHKVSIIIPAAAAPSNVIECVEAAREYHADNVEIVVVTNSAGIEKELSAYGKIKVLTARHACRTPEQLQCGFDKTSGEIKVMLMPYCIPAGKRWLKGLVTPFEEDTKTGAVVSRCELSKPKHWNLSARLLDSVMGINLAGRHKKDGELEVLSNCCDALRADVLEEAQFSFHERLDASASAIDLSMMLKERQYKIMLSPTSRVTIHPPSESRKLSSVFSKAFQAGRIDHLMGEKWKIDWLQGRLFMAVFLSLFLIPVGLFSLPLAVIFAGGLFAWGWFLPFRIPPIPWDWPVAVLNAGVYTVIILWIRDTWAADIFPPRRWHPAIIRQWCILASMSVSYLLLAGTIATKKVLLNAHSIKDILLIPVTAVLGTVWHVMTGVGFIGGYLARKN